MENVLLWVAYAAFILAFCSLVASVIIFVKADVPDAIRFLRHKPMKSQSSGKASAKRRKSGKGDKDEAKPKKATPQPKRPTRSTEEVVEKAASASLDPEQLAVKPTTGTTVIGEEELIIEPGTAVLADEAPENDDAEKPTTVLVEEGTERPTSVLLDDEDDTERPTTVLDEDDDTERPTSVLDDDDTERPTSVLDTDDTERPTSVLDDGIPDGAIVSHKAESAEDFGPTFKFQIKKKIVSINTEERI